LKGNRNIQEYKQQQQQCQCTTKKIGWWFFEAEGNESSFCYDSMARE